MKALAFIKNGILALFSHPHDVKKQVTVNPVTTFHEFERLCHDLRIKGARALYRDYVEAYHERVEAGYDGLHPYEFFRQQNMLTM